MSPKRIPLPAPIANLLALTTAVTWVWLHLLGESVWGYCRVMSWLATHPAVGWPSDCLHLWRRGLSLAELTAWGRRLPLVVWMTTSELWYLWKLQSPGYQLAFSEGWRYIRALLSWLLTLMGVWGVGPF